MSSPQRRETDESASTEKPEARLPSWCWCIATYNRHDVLALSCGLALEQSAPPAELVITDASDDWERGRELIFELVDLACEHGLPRPRVSYERAQRASSAHQRNQSIARSRADIVFLFDDDSLMFSDTAEKVLEVYKLDTKHQIQAVTTLRRTDRPDLPIWLPRRHQLPDSTDPSRDSQTRNTGIIAAWARSLLRADDRFVSYDFPAPHHPVPEYLADLDVTTWKVAAGFHLTCRRESALREPFEGRLKGYSPGEDSDMTYRLTRHGPLVARRDAFVCHLESPGSRFGVRERTARGALNPLLLHRVHSTNLERSVRENKQLLRRRLAIELLKDVRDRSLTFPRARGIFQAMRQLQSIMNTADDQISDMFSRYQ